MTVGAVAECIIQPLRKSIANYVLKRDSPRVPFGMQMINPDLQNLDMNLREIIAGQNTIVCDKKIVDRIAEGLFAVSRGID